RLKVSATAQAQLREQLDLALQHGKGVVHVQTQADAPAAVFSAKGACPNCGTGFPELDPRLFSFNSKHGWCKGCFGTGLQLPEFDAEQSGEETVWRDAADTATQPCPVCAGRRLNPIALNVLFRDSSIAALTHLPVQDFAAQIAKLKLVGR